MTQNAPKTLSVQESEKLLYAFCPGYLRGLPEKRAFRNRLVVLLMLDAGLRVGEVVKLKISDLCQFDKPLLRLSIDAEYTKTKAERIIPISARLAGAITDCWESCWYRPAACGDCPAVPGADNRHPVTTVQIQRIIKGAAQRVLGRRVTPHMLRHTFASRLMRTSPVRVVMELLGHKNLASTQIYMHPNQTDLDNAVKSLE